MDVDVDATVAAVALRHLGERFVSHVFTEPVVNSLGEEALRIVIVLKDPDVSGISGEMALNTLVEMRKALQSQGDMRQPLVEYDAGEELGEDDLDDADPES